MTLVQASSIIFRLFLILFSLILLKLLFEVFKVSLRKKYQINIKSGTPSDSFKCSENQFFTVLHQPVFFQNFWYFSWLCCMCCMFYLL